MRRRATERPRAFLCNYSQSVSLAHNAIPSLFIYFLSKQVVVYRGNFLVLIAYNKHMLPVLTGRPRHNNQRKDERMNQNRDPANRL